MGIETAGRSLLACWAEAMSKVFNDFRTVIASNRGDDIPDVNLAAAQPQTPPRGGTTESPSGGRGVKIITGSHSPRGSNRAFGLPDQLVPRSRLRECVPVSDMTIWSWVRAGVFPRPIKISARNYWRLSDLQAWFDAQHPTPQDQQGPAPERTVPIGS